MPVLLFHCITEYNNQHHPYIDSTTVLSDTDAVAVLLVTVELAQARPNNMLAHQYADIIKNLLEFCSLACQPLEFIRWVP